MDVQPRLLGGGNTPSLHDQTHRVAQFHEAEREFPDMSCISRGAAKVHIQSEKQKAHRSGSPERSIGAGVTTTVDGHLT